MEHDVMMGTETHLDPSIYDAELFTYNTPSDYM